MKKATVDLATKAVLGIGGLFAAFKVWSHFAKAGVEAPAADFKSPIDSHEFTTPAEPYAAYDAANSCSPAPKPGAVMFRDWVLHALNLGGYDAGIARDCAAGGTSEHKEGRAWDWGVLKYKDSEAVPPERIQAFLDALLANDAELLRRAGIMYMIYNRKIWSAARHAEGWRPYTGPSAHTDHVHFSFSRAGADGKTSLYTEALNRKA